MFHKRAQRDFDVFLVLSGVWKPFLYSFIHSCDTVLGPCMFNVKVKQGEAYQNNASLEERSEEKKRLTVVLVYVLIEWYSRTCKHCNYIESQRDY